MACQDVQNQGVVLHGAGDGTDMIQRPESGKTPLLLTRPKVGFMPTIPQRAAGMRMEPPVSEPSAP